LGDQRSALSLPMPFVAAIKASFIDISPSRAATGIYIGPFD
jgi:hypothetical protein